MPATFPKASLAVAVAVFAAACSSGPAAPPTDPVRTVCTVAFCMDVPDGWDGEMAETFISFHHEILPDGTFLTANVVDAEAIVTAAGGTWPVPPDDTVAAFWSLLEDVDEGELGRTERMVGGAVRSWGRHSTGDMWYLFVPIEGSTGIGVEMRAPNDSWERHADVVFSSVLPVP